MASEWWRPFLAVAARTGLPLLVGGLVYLVLSVLLVWPPTWAVVAAYLATRAAGRTTAWLVRGVTDPLLLGRSLLYVVAAAGGGLLVLVAVRGLLLALGWLPGTAVLLAAVVAWIVAQAVLLPAFEPGSAAFVRGQRLMGRRRALRRLQQAIRNEAAPSEARPCWGGLEQPEGAADGQYLAVGAPGSGKSTVISILMASVLRSVGRGRGLRALVYDDKQEYYALLHGLLDDPARLVTLNPLDQRGCAWDIARDATDPAVIGELSLILVPPDEQSTQPYFANAAAALVEGVMNVFGERAPGLWTFRDLLEACWDEERLRRVLTATPAGTEVYRKFYRNQRTYFDVLTTLHTKIKQFRPLAAGWEAAERRVSLSDWLAGEGILVLSNDSTVHDHLESLNRMLFDRLVQLLTAGERNAGRTWVFLDELREAPRFQHLHTLFNQGRSMGVSSVIGFQTIEGLQALYGPKEALEIASAGASRAFLRTDSAATGEWAAGELDQAEVLHYPRSWGARDVSVQEQRSDRRLVTPGQLRALPRPKDSGWLCGWWVTPYTGPYEHRLSREEVERLRPRPREGVANYLRRPSEALRLRPWDDDDLARLNLPPGGPTRPPGPGRKRRSADGAPASFPRQRLRDTDRWPGG